MGPVSDSVYTIAVSARSGPSFSLESDRKGRIDVRADWISFKGSKLSVFAPTCLPPNLGAAKS